MKTMKLIGVILVTLFAISSCQRGNSIIVNDGSTKLKINYWGDIKFTDDEKSIKSISHGGYLNFRKNEVSLLAETNDKGEIKYELHQYGNLVDINSPDGKMLITKAIRDMISVGFDVQGRLQRISQNGGLRAVLIEVDSLDGDFVKSIYLQYLISSDSISPEEMTEIAGKIRRNINSDFEKGKLLSKFSTDCLKDSLTARAYFAAVKSIDSDFEKANALRNILKQPLTNEQFVSALGVINIIGSDFERANLLKELIDQEIFEDDSFGGLLGSINHLDSNFEKGNLLKRLVGKDIETENQWIGIIKVTEHITGDFERSNILLQIADNMPKKEQLMADYLKVAQTINGEMERGRVLKALE